MKPSLIQNHEPIQDFKFCTMLLTLYNQLIHFLLSRCKRTHAGSSERPIGHRICCSLLQQAYNTTATKRNNKKFDMNTLNLNKRYVVSSIKRWAQVTFHKSCSTQNKTHKKMQTHYNTFIYNHS